MITFLSFLKTHLSRLSVPQQLIIVNFIAFSLIGICLFIIQNKEQTRSSLLASHITMSTIELKVNNFAAMDKFYTTMLGMQTLSHNTSSVTLGYNKQGVLKLDNTQQLHQSSLADPGLDQIAIVFNSREGLAKTLKRIMDKDPLLYAGGTSRGAIGEAFYVTDPAGNSLELYYDTDPATWPRRNGEVLSDALPIDINQYIARYKDKSGNLGMKTGHLQIRIGDITLGRQFYINTIGFTTASGTLGGQSLFLSDGYYHHDLVINQAQGYDGDSITNYLGLRGFSIILPDIASVKRLKSRLTKAQIPYQTKGSFLLFTDPWGIQITIGSLKNSLWDKITAFME